MKTRDLEFGFCGGTKAGGPGGKSSEQGREPTIKLNLNVSPGLGMMSNHNDHNICDKNETAKYLVPSSETCF